LKLIIIAANISIFFYQKGALMKKLLLLLTVVFCAISSIYTAESVPLTKEEAEKVVTKQQELSADLAELDNVVTESIGDIAKDVSIVRFTITLYKDQIEHNSNDWKEVVTKAVQSLYRLQSNEEYHENILQELNDIIDTLESKDVENGIAGEFVVEISDGKPMENCCGQNCKCAEMYRGNCPCSLNNARSNRCCTQKKTSNCGTESTCCNN
jgi:hypothetical protein